MKTFLFFSRKERSTQAKMSAALWNEMYKFRKMPLNIYITQQVNFLLQMDIVQTEPDSWGYFWDAAQGSEVLEMANVMLFKNQRPFV